jgi:hypothetical protein
MTTCHSEPSDFFFEVSSPESAEGALKRLADAWPADVLTGLHYLVGHGRERHVIGASFIGPITPHAVITIAGPQAKLTELTLAEIIRRIGASEFADCPPRRRRPDAGRGAVTRDLEATLKNTNRGTPPSSATTVRLKRS